MKQNNSLKNLLWPLLAVSVLYGCNDNDDDTGSVDISPKFSSVVSFGDSLSDAGTYAVGTVASSGGGKFTINGDGDTMWLDYLATALGMDQPCAAETGLDGDANYGLNVAVEDHEECTDYAQGGARVTEAVGPGNAALGGDNATIGMLTVPVKTQIANHLAAHGSFSGDELVTVLAGANDLFINLQLVGVTLTTDQAIAAMVQAADELAGYIQDELIANGATKILVVTVPDVSLTPMALAESSDVQSLVYAMTYYYNTELQAQLADVDEVAFADAFTAIEDEVANPDSYGLDNVTTPACNLDATVNFLSSSLICTSTNLIDDATDNYLFADDVHPTPFGYNLLAVLGLETMAAKGWI